MTGDGRAEQVSIEPLDAKPSVAILAYHKIGPGPGGWDTWFHVPEAIFAAHLRVLHEEAWQVVDADRLLSGLDDPSRLPARSAVITFDDAFRSVREVGLPWLKRFGFPSIVFVPTDFIGQGNDFDRDWAPRESICGWDDLRALDDAGTSIQSHGASHRGFSELSLREVESEISCSKRLLEQGMGKTVEMLAFPFGDAGERPNELDDALERAGYRAAFLFRGGIQRLPARDRFRIARLAMGPDTDLRSELAVMEQCA